MLSPDSVFILGGAHLPPEHRLVLAFGKGFIPLPRPRQQSDIEIDLRSFSRRLRLRYMFKNSMLRSKGVYWPNSKFVPDNASKTIETYISNTADRIRNKVTMDNKGYSNISAMKRCDSKKLISTLSYLKDNELCVTLADKNLGMVVTPTQIYINAIMQALQQGFAEISEKEAYDNIQHVYREIITARNKFVDSEEAAFKYLENVATPKNSAFPTPYGLWKVHKLKTIAFTCIPPMRLIVPVGRSILRGVSKYIDELVRPIFNQKVTQNLRDTKSLIQQLENTKLPTTAQLAVQDIISLYPSVDIDDGLIKFRNFLSDSSLHNHQICYIMDMTTLIMKNNIIQFQGRFYKQMVGVAMGNPLAPTFASTWVHALEVDLLQRYEKSSKLLIYKRLIDDSLSIFINKTSCYNFWREYNQLHENLKTTGQGCDNNSWEYLDLILHKGRRFYESGILDTKLHQKTFNNYGYLPYTSYHPLKTKGNWITAEASRAIRAFSDLNDYEKYLPLLATRLAKRKYPIKFILHHIFRTSYQSRKQLIFGESKKQAKERKQQRTIFTTYFNPTINKFDLRNELRQGWEKISEDHGWNEPPLVAFKKENNMFNIFRKTLPR